MDTCKGVPWGGQNSINFSPGLCMYLKPPNFIKRNFIFHDYVCLMTTYEFRLTVSTLYVYSIVSH